MTLFDILSQHPNLQAVSYDLPPSISIPREAPHESVRLRKSAGRKATQIAEFTRYVEIFLQGRKAAIVDVGAGQALLTRSLASLSSYCLALDSDPNLTAKDVDSRVVDVTESTLVSTILDWLPDPNLPVLVVALHACGSLSVDIFRALKNPPFQLLGAIVIPCCWNLLRQGDFPLAKCQEYPEYPVLTQNIPQMLPLPPSAYHLAAQTSAIWDPYDPNWQLGIRKVVWRALLERLIPDGIQPEGDWDIELKKQNAPVPRRFIYDQPTISHEGLGTGHTSSLHQLGKLPKSSYVSWDAFLHASALKTGIEYEVLRTRNQILDEQTETGPPKAPMQDPGGYVVHPAILALALDPDSESSAALRNSILDPLPDPSPPFQLARILFDMHLVRILQGPMIESWLLLDRARWVNDLRNTTERPWSVSLVPLFDQKTASARNMAVVVEEFRDSAG
ncbi:hypothetical protein C8J56DRAFT_933360 [Mycena floridula]|nr:hypothetical protein C8J56DRAFT_933360 [Mycena floridula]